MIDHVNVHHAALPGCAYGHVDHDDRWLSIIVRLPEVDVAFSIMNDRLDAQVNRATVVNKLNRHGVTNVERVELLTTTVFELIRLLLGV